MKAVLYVCHGSRVKQDGQLAIVVHQHITSFAIESKPRPEIQKYPCKVA
jgi:hypothetical protein